LVFVRLARRLRLKCAANFLAASDIACFAAGGIRPLHPRRFIRTASVSSALSHPTGFSPTQIPALVIMMSFQVQCPATSRVIPSTPRILRLSIVRERGRCWPENIARFLIFRPGNGSIQRAQALALCVRRSRREFSPSAQAVRKILFRGLRFPLLSMLSIAGIALWLLLIRRDTAWETPDRRCCVARMRLRGLL
jgi:hypothetical protein